MDDAVLSATDLDARLRDGIARRLDAVDPHHRARAGADIIAIVTEIRRRDAGRAAHDRVVGSPRNGLLDGHADARPVRSAPSHPG